MFVEDTEISEFTIPTLAPPAPPCPVIIVLREVFLKQTKDRRPGTHFTE